MIEAVAAENMIKREKELVKIARTKMPVLIPPKIDVLIVEEIGKNISGPATTRIFWGKVPY